jgi:hypothetical protein
MPHSCGGIWQAHILVFFFCVTTGIWYLPVGKWGGGGLSIINITIIDGKIRSQRENYVSWIRQDEKADHRFQSFGKPVFHQQRRKLQICFCKISGI